MFTRIRKTLPSHNLLTEIQNGTATLENNLDISFLKTFTVEKENSRKTSTSALLITPKTLTVWITTNYGKFFFFLENS